MILWPKWMSCYFILYFPTILYNGNISWGHWSAALKYGLQMGQARHAETYCSAGVSDIILNGLSDFCECNWYLTSLKFHWVPIEYTEKHLSCCYVLCFGGTRFTQSWLQIWEVAAFKALQDRHSSLAIEIWGMWPTSYRQCSPSCPHVALISQTVAPHLSIWTFAWMSLLWTHLTSNTNTSLSSDSLWQRYEL